VVVLGYTNESLIPLIESMDIKWVINHNYELGMFTSIQTGAQHIDPTSKGFFMMPVDMPLVRPDTITQLIQAYDDQVMDVLYPSYEGRRGHPPLISCHLIPELLNSSDSGGLKSFLDRRGRGSYLEISDPAILMDMNTEEAYAKLKEYYIGCVLNGSD